MRHEPSRSQCSSNPKWVLMNSARGIVSGATPHLRIFILKPVRFQNAQKLLCHQWDLRKAVWFCKRVVTFKNASPPPPLPVDSFDPVAFAVEKRNRVITTRTNPKSKIHPPIEAGSAAMPGSANRPGSPRTEYIRPSTGFST